MLIPIFGGFSTITPASISSPWSDLVVAYPTDTDTTGARTITFGSGSRTVTVTGESVALSLEYSINGGAWTDYTAGFSLTSGQTLNWRGTFSQNSAGSCNVYVDGVLLDTFAKTATGFP